MLIYINKNYYSNSCRVFACCFNSLQLCDTVTVVYAYTDTPTPTPTQMRIEVRDIICMRSSVHLLSVKQQQQGQCYNRQCKYESISNR